MLTGSSLNKMMETFPNRTFDVGIAEQHAVTLSAGFATQGLVPFCVIYSTFLQRAYDQIIHDVALQNLPVIFCIDRAGLVGEDGATHHGVFDIAFLRCVPNLIICAPRNENELRNILYSSQLDLKSPIAIRYPRGYGLIRDWRNSFEKIEIGKGVLLKEGEDIALLSFGTISENISKVIQNMKGVAHYDMRFAKPLDTKLLDIIFQKFKKIITVEDGVITGGFGNAILEYSNSKSFKGEIEILGIKDSFIEHGTISKLQVINNIDEESILNTIKKKNKKILDSNLMLYFHRKIKKFE